MNYYLKPILIFLFILGHLGADLLKENYIVFNLNSSSPKALLDVEADNLDRIFDLDINRNSIISWKELRSKKEKITSYILDHISIEFDDKECKITATDFIVHRKIHQSYIKLPLLLECAKPKTDISLRYNLFFDLDKDQKLFVKLDNNQSRPAIIDPLHKEFEIKLKNDSFYDTFIEYIKTGIWHIWLGYDHILFLLMLLVPSVYIQNRSFYAAKKSFKEIFIDVVKIATAFSIAHSFTLALSAFELIKLPANFIEVLIAITIIITALNNIFDLFRVKIWKLAFGFGLIHGFGFANVLRELVNDKTDFVSLLVGFNIGVEIGQLAIIAVVLPILYLFRNSKYYRFFVLQSFSFFVLVIATIWAIERSFGVEILTW